jgi:hypothetical protein
VIWLEIVEVGSILFANQKFIANMTKHRKKRVVRSFLAKEQWKLTGKEDDWKLVGATSTGFPTTRTRGGGSGRPNMNRKIAEEISSDSEEDVVVMETHVDDADNELSSDEEVDPEEEDEVSTKKPRYNRIIIETNALNDIIANNCHCSECMGPVDIEYKTICLATTIELTCKNVLCGYVYHSLPPAKARLGNLVNRERSTDFAINIQYVLAFISSGDGGVEAARVLGLMGLPNDTTMETRQFPMIEERISPFVQKLAKDILLENLTEEVRLCFEASPDHHVLDFNNWKQALTDKTVVIPPARFAKIDVSFDMGWQQRSSGNRYASPSGDALLVGARTRKPVAIDIKSKKCNFCSAWDRNKKTEGDPPEHNCRKNHNGSSSSMEACLLMVVDLYNNANCIVFRICADDDASTRSLLRWSNADYMRNNGTTEVPKVFVTKGPNKGVKQQPRPDRGRLPGHIPEPLFVADPNHRRKVFTGELLTLKMSKVATRFTMTKMDCTRLGKNFGYMVRTLKRRPEAEWEGAGRAVIEHHFDNHEFCGEWCPRKRQGQEERDAKARYYRSKTEDAKLYAVLNNITSRFITLDRLKEVAHGMDTQINESFNNTASWFAPKNKVYCGSESLANRLSLLPSASSPLASSVTSHASAHS